jgi:aminodeoxyfutalosine deaminase
MVEAGLFVTLNSDDPPMFGTSLSNEYLVAASSLGFSPAELAGLAGLAGNGVRASFLDATSKEALLTEIAAVPLPRTRARPGGSGDEDDLPAGVSGG